MSNWVVGLTTFLRDSGLERGREESGEELVRRFLSGEGGFTQVLGKYHSLLISKSSNFIRGYSQSDLYQELALKMFQCCHSWEGDKKVSFHTYLYKSLDNHLKMLGRKSNSQKRMLERELVSYEAILASREEECGDGPFYEEPCMEEPGYYLVELLAATRLSERERVCVEMIAEGRMSYEIAEHLGISRAGVSNLLRRLAPKLRSLFN